jgi:hypothetical protein
MLKRTFLIWVVILVFGLTSLPVIGYSSESKQTGNAEITKKKPKKKTSKKKKKSLKKKKSSKKLKSAGKKNISKKKKYTKKSKFTGSKKYSKKKSYKRKKSYVRRYYAPPTNSSSVEYRTYKRNSDNNNESELNIEKIAPSKELRKEPKKESDN